MLLALGLDQVDPGHRLQQVRGRGVHEGDGIHLAGLQRGHAGVHICDALDFDLVEMGAALLPVIREALHAAADARFVAFQRRAAGADALVEITVLGGHDQHRHHTQQRRKARVRRGQRDTDLVRAGRLDVGDGLEQGLGLRDRVGAAVQVQRPDHVIGGHGLAAVELDPVAQLEGPFGQVVVAAPFGRKLGNQLAARPDLDQAVAQLVLQLHHEAAFVELRVQGLGGVEIGDRQAEGAALAGVCVLRQGAAGPQPQHGGGGHRPRPKQKRTSGGQQGHRVSCSLW